MTTVGEYDLWFINIKIYIIRMAYNIIIYNNNNNERTLLTNRSWQYLGLIYIYI
jgi:hypothetical protein